MKTAAEIKFNRVIKEGFHETLKPLGFKKKANNFYLQLPDIGQIINIQKSAWGTKDHISFTINTGLFLPEYWIGLIYNKGKEVPAFPTEPECLIRKRIGNLRNQHDTWYDIDERANEHDLIVEMKANLEEFILPYFNSAKEKNEILELLDSEKQILTPLGKLITYSELKLFEKAKLEYLSLIRGKNNTLFLETVKEYGKKYGLE